jgi:hypothetical protein
MLADESSFRSVKPARAAQGLESGLRTTNET